jgi:Fe-S-cluster-containing hydrogenase component 2
MSCTSVCPAGALSAGDELPRLVFHETNCVQCGICANACPESAIRLVAGYATSPDQRRAARVLHEEPPFCCVSCGKPFATRRVIDNILGKLADHAMFQSDRAKRRLQMCEDCRVVDAVQDSEAMQAGLFAGNRPSNKGQDLE